MANYLVFELRVLEIQFELKTSCKLLPLITHRVRDTRLQVAFHCANLDEWRRNLSMLLRDPVKQEVISREKKDRRDFDKLAALATSLGLYR